MVRIGEVPSRWRAVPSRWRAVLSGAGLGEGPFVLSDAVDNGHELSHDGGEGDLWVFSSFAESEVVVAQAGIVSDRGEDGHPEGLSEAGVSEGGDTSSGRTMQS